MNTLAIKQSKVHNETPGCSISFNWADNPDVRHLLDTISSIIANEYIKIAKNNPDIFSNIPPHPPSTTLRAGNPLPEGEKG